uniref:Uncharacterized protein n=1 Tax=Ditylenchus dipsaci TaxID=166011 RepID=A0A915DMS0_9BILA
MCARCAFQPYHQVNRLIFNFLNCSSFSPNLKCVIGCAHYLSLAQSQLEGMDFASGVWDEEKKCLLTPTSLNSHTFMQSESDLVQDVSTAASVDATSSQPAHQFFFTSPLIYSEPALSSLGNSVINYNNVVSCAYSEATLPNVYIEDSISPSGLPGANMSDGANKPAITTNPPSHSTKCSAKALLQSLRVFFSESQPSIITVMGPSQFLTSNPSAPGKSENNTCKFKKSTDLPENGTTLTLLISKVF